MLAMNTSLDAIKTLNSHLTPDPLSSLLHTIRRLLVKPQNLPHQHNIMRRILLHKQRDIVPCTLHLLSPLLSS
jgi:hypothetical protein